VNGGKGLKFTDTTALAHITWREWVSHNTAKIWANECNLQWYTTSKSV